MLEFITGYFVGKHLLSNRNKPKYEIGDLLRWSRPNYMDCKVKVIDIHCSQASNEAPMYSYSCKVISGSDRIEAFEYQLDSLYFFEKCEVPFNN